MSSPVAVIIGDIHFTPATLELAATSLRQALREAERLGVPLVINGDTLDSKAIIRAECANSLINTLCSRTFVPGNRNPFSTEVYVNTGNHDLISEKGKTIAIGFLSPYANVISSPAYIDTIQSYIVPYMNSSEELQKFLNSIEKGSRLIIHQGVMSANMGHYITDKTSLPKEAFADFRVIASHYHRRQDIKCGRPRKGAVGLFSYIGNPYTLSFGEAEDPPKGFAVLHDDGTLTHVPTNLRAHKVVEHFTDSGEWKGIPVNPHDPVWMKVHGPRSRLDALDKAEIGRMVLGHSNFKLDKIYTDAAPLEAAVDKLTGEEILDKLIDNLPDSMDEKTYLKQLWRELLETC